MANLLDRRIVLVVVSLLAVLWLQAPRLLDEFQIDEDFRTFYWMNKYQEPALYPDDRLGGHRYTAVQWFNGELPIYFYSLGYASLFFLGSFVLTPVLLSKLLPFLVMPITVWYLYEFGQMVHSASVGIALAVGFIFINLASPTSLSVITGLQRSFAAPLMIALVYYLHREKYIAAAVVVMVSALIYPPVFFLAAISWGLYAMTFKWPLSIKWMITSRGLGALLVAFFLSALTLLPVLLPRAGNVFADEKTVEAPPQPLVNESQEPYRFLWDNPHFQAGGRKPLFSVFPFIGRAGLVNKELDALHFSILFAVGCLIFLVRGRRALQLPYVVWCVLWGSLAAFVLAWAGILLTSSFLFYLPSRYTRVGLFLFLLMFVFLNGEDFVLEASQLLQRHREKLIWVIGLIEIIVLGLILLYPSEQAIYFGLNVKWLLAPAGLIFGVLGLIYTRKRLSAPANSSKNSSTPGLSFLVGIFAALLLVGWIAYAPLVTKAFSVNPDPTERELLKFLETLPQDTLIAGTPCALDSVLLFSKRQILFSCEKLSKDTQLVSEALRVYYTDDEWEVADFCQKQSIDHLVIDQRTYSEEFLADGVIFFEPYNQELLPYVERQEGFALVNVPDEAKIFQAEHYFVVPCGHFTAQ